MTDPDAVASALARLATASPRPPDDDISDPERVVADAESAMDRVDSAAAFVQSGGERRLRRAVRDADAAGDDSCRSRGQAVLATLDAFRAAAGSGDDLPAEPGSTSRTTSTTLAQRSSGEGS